MSDTICVITLKGETFRPGDPINGALNCNFPTETKVRGIKVRFRGSAKVSWQESRSTNDASHTYFDMESEMLTDETTFPPGQYVYPFSFALPTPLPSSLDDDIGKIKYSVKAIIDRPWAFDYTSKKYFTIENVVDLNDSNAVKPMQFKKKKLPFSLKSNAQPINLIVDLPHTGFVPSEVICFRATIKNESQINVKGLHFKLAQGFHYKTEWRKKTETVLESEEIEVIDGSVAAGTEKSWELQLKVPSNILNGLYEPCDIIRPFFEMQGEVFLPFFYKNAKITIPLSLGTIPVSQSGVEL